MWTQEQLDYINQRWTQLNTLSNDAADKAKKYLLLTNAGGAIATLSFLGAVENIRSQWAPKVALSLFLIGLILIGVNTALWVHHIEGMYKSWLEGMYKSWRKNTAAFFEHKIDWDTLNAGDDALAYKTTWLYVTGYSSFLCFIAGAGVGLVCSSF
jgi:hypothetical protein